MNDTSKPPKSAADRQREFKARMRAKGYKQVTMWIDDKENTMQQQAITATVQLIDPAGQPFGSFDLPSCRISLEALEHAATVAGSASLSDYLEKILIEAIEKHGQDAQ